MLHDDWQDDEMSIDELLEENGLDLHEANMFAMNFKRKRQRQLDARLERRLSWMGRGVQMVIIGLLYCWVYFKLS